MGDHQGPGSSRILARVGAGGVPRRVDTVRGRSGVVIRGSMTQTGVLDGKLTVEGFDAWGRPWKMLLQMDGLILRDDGLPSGGTISLSGSDPSGASKSGHLTFPIPDPAPKAVQKERRRNMRPKRRY